MSLTTHSSALYHPPSVSLILLEMCFLASASFMSPVYLPCGVPPWKLLLGFHDTTLSWSFLGAGRSLGFLFLLLFLCFLLLPFLLLFLSLAPPCRLCLPLLSDSFPQAITSTRVPPNSRDCAGWSVPKGIGPRSQGGGCLFPVSAKALRAGHGLASCIPYTVPLPSNNLTFLAAHRTLRSP